MMKLQVRATNHSKKLWKGSNDVGNQFGVLDSGDVDGNSVLGSSDAVFSKKANVATAQYEQSGNGLEFDEDSGYDSIGSCSSSPKSDLNFRHLRYLNHHYYYNNQNKSDCFSILLNLPFGVIERIGSFLSFTDFISLTRTCKYLWQEPAEYPGNQEVLLMEMCRLGAPNHLIQRQIFVEKQIMPRSVDPKCSDNLAIRIASDNGHLDIVCLLLLEAKVDPTARGNQALRLAAMNGHCDVVRLLVSDPRVDPTVEDNIIIRIACERGNLAIVNVLLKLDPTRNVNPAAQSNYAIKAACKNGHENIVMALLEDNRVNPCVDANVCLRSAAKKGHYLVVRQLLAHPKVDPSAKDNEALIWAATHGHTNVVRLLLSDPRVNPSARDNFALLQCCELGQETVVKMLLSSGKCSLACRNYKCLLVAASKGHKEVMKHLVAANNTIPLQKLKEAYDLAYMYGYPEIMLCLDEIINNK